jgi:hypothetical protein
MTGNLAVRRSQHALDPVLRDYTFEVVHRTNDYATRRGLEEILHQTFRPPLNFQNPIRMNHPNLEDYILAAVRFLLGR